MLKFWCREPPGSKLEQAPSTDYFQQEHPPTYYHGPIKEGTYIAPVRNPSTTPASQGAHNAADPFHRVPSGQRERGGLSGTKDFHRERRTDGFRPKRFRDSGNER